MEIKFNISIDDRMVKLGTKIFRKRVLFPLGSLVFLLGASLLFANVPHVFTNGQLTDATQINDNFNAVVDLSVPIGGIIPWHKTLVGSTTLSDRWIECNGQTVNDTASPLYGQTVPDLNNTALFLRGGTTSGVYQDDQMQSHKHNDSGHSHTYRNHYNWYNSHGPSNSWGAMNINQRNENTQNGHANLTDPVESSAGSVRHGNETRPKNMSMVWIMRVK